MSTEREPVAWWNQWGEYRELWTDKKRADAQIANWERFNLAHPDNPSAISQRPLVYLNPPSLEAVALVDGLDGSWPENDLRRAFVEGACWWEYKKTEATMWPSDRDGAEEEAERRFAHLNPPTREPLALEVAQAYKDAPCFTVLLGEVDEDEPCQCPTCALRLIAAILTEPEP